MILNIKKKVTFCYIGINYFFSVAFICPNTISQNTLQQGLCPSWVGLAHPHAHARSEEYLWVGFLRPTFFTPLPPTAHLCPPADLQPIASTLPVSPDRNGRGLALFWDSLVSSSQVARVYLEAKADAVASAEGWQLCFCAVEILANPCLFFPNRLCSIRVFYQVF